MSEHRTPPDSHKEALAALEKKLHLVRDHVTAVAKQQDVVLFDLSGGASDRSW
jgi:hypothetical protein